jgi:hypothetical protein
MARSPIRRLVERGIEAGADYIPDVVEGPLRGIMNMPDLAAKPPKSMAVRTTPTPAPKTTTTRKTTTRKKPVVKALPPPPPPPLALPAPGPGLPEFAAKPRGGQWWADQYFEGSNVSPEEAARQGALSLALTRWVPEGEGVVNAGQQITETPAQKWLERALTKYYKNEFGTPEDPLRDLAARGLHYDPDMTPERWQQTVNDYLMEDTIGDITLPNMLFDKNAYPGVGDEFTTEARMAMPWLAKQPVTDKLYGISGGGLDLSHFTDEFLNALNDAEAVGLPADFAVRPESLARMTFPQAVERVGRINQFRAKEMERAALSNLDSPAVQTFKEYAENNPMGLRWTELRQPENIETPEFQIANQSFTQRGLRIGDKYYEVPFDVKTGSADYEGVARDIARREALEKALKYEGDTMGHCVGGYCPDVMSGRSRIFSLRDAKGEPHVTIETAPNKYPDIPIELADKWADEIWNEAQAKGLTGSALEAYDRAEYRNRVNAWRADNANRQDIIQIKGKQNRAPKDDYLPFVQDFVKSGQWGNVGDLGNTGLVKLPDGRYITQQQLQEGVARKFNIDPSEVSAEQPRYYEGLMQANWNAYAPHFEGFAIGGRVDRNRCFSRHPMSAR